MSVFQYKTAAGSNTSVDGVNIAEGMAPGGVNNALRALMADTRKLQLDMSADQKTTGTASNYQFTARQGFSEYAAGMRFCLRLHTDNAATATLNINGVGPVDLKVYRGGVAVRPAAGVLKANTVVDVVYVSADAAFVVLNLPNVGAADLGVSDGNKLIGRYSTNAGPAQEAGVGNGLEFNGSFLRVAFDAGLEFVNTKLSVIFASRAEAEAGENNGKSITPLRAGQAMAYRRDREALGWEQRWQDMLSNRQRGTAYTNGTGRPIMVSVCSDGVPTDFQVSENGSNWVTVGRFGESGQVQTTVTVIVPAGHRYRTGDSGTIFSWAELR